MAMIALARLVIIAQDAFTIANERQPVLETMPLAAHRTRDLPDDNFDEAAVVKHVPLVDQQLGLHVGIKDNIARLLSMSPTLSRPTGGGPPLSTLKALA
jgi:hypothetical protein